MKQPIRRGRGHRVVTRAAALAVSLAAALTVVPAVLPAAPGGGAAPVSAQTLAQAPADTTIVIRSTGAELVFMPAQIAVKQGLTLRIRYINEGTVSHNVVLVRDDDDIDVLGVAAMAAGATGYVPEHEKARMLAWSALAEPGKTVEFTFVVPPAGDYPFVCLYPGHYNMMVGTLRSLR